MIRDLIAQGIKTVSWKIKLFTLKIRHGNRIVFKWNDRIAWSVKVRINGRGKVSFGENIELRENVILNVSDGGYIEIGDRVFLNDGCMINARERVVIGADTMFGQSVKVYDHDHDYRSNNFKTDFKCEEILINRCVWVCSDSIILKGCTIGDKSVIAAATIVRECVEPNTLYYTKRVCENKQVKVSSQEI